MSTSPSRQLTALRALALGACISPAIVATSAHAQTTGFNQTGGGPFAYELSTNWVDGAINGIWDSSLTLTSNQTVTVANGTDFTDGLQFLHKGSRTVTLRASGTAATANLLGDVIVLGSSVTIGSTNASNALNLDLGGGTATLAVAGVGSGSDFGNTLDLLNTVSNGNLVIAGHGTWGKNNGGSVRLSANGNTLDTVTLLGAQLNVSGANNSTSQNVTTISDLVASQGPGILLLTANASQNNLIQVDNFTREAGSSLLIRGANLGTSTAASATAGTNNLVITNAPVLVGGTGANGTDLGILVGVYGDASSSGKGTGLMTYDAANGVRLLDTTTEYTAAIADGQTQLDNVRLVGNSGSAFVNTITTDTTINSLSFATTTAGSTLTVDGTGKLILNSGVIFARQDVNNYTSTADVQTLSVATLDFAGREGVITSVSNIQNLGHLGALTIDSALTNATGITKNGSGALNLGGSAVNTYTGAFTVNDGSVRLGRTSTNNTITGDLVVNGGTAMWAASNQIADTGDITINNNGYVQFSDRNFGSAFNETFRNLTINGGEFRGGYTDRNNTVSMQNATVAGGLFSHMSGSLVQIADTLHLSGGSYVLARSSATGSATSVLEVGDIAISNTAAGAYTALTLTADASRKGALVKLSGDLTFTGNGTNANTARIASTDTALANQAMIALEGARTFSIGDGAAAIDLEISAVLADGSTAGGLVKTGAGALRLAVANTYTGVTTLQQGELILGTANALASSSLLLEGGVLDVDGHDQTFGAVTLAGNTTIDLGVGDVSLLFGDSHALAWSDSVSLGFINVDAADSIRFGTDSGGLTAQQLAKITINGQSVQIGGDGLLAIAPIPEPASAALVGSAGVLLLVGASRRRRA